MVCYVRMSVYPQIIGEFTVSAGSAPCPRLFIITSSRPQRVLPQMQLITPAGRDVPVLSSSFSKRMGVDMAVYGSINTVTNGNIVRGHLQPLAHLTATPSPLWIVKDLTSSACLLFDSSLCVARLRTALCLCVQ